MLKFTNKLQAPTLAEVENVLGENFQLYESVLKENDIKETVWRYYSKSSGWVLQCKRDDHNLFYIQVLQTGFNVWLTLGNKAKSKAIEVLQSEDLKKVILAAKEYKEGTSFKVEVKTPADVNDIVLLAQLKTNIKVLQ